MTPSNNSRRRRIALVGWLAVLFGGLVGCGQKHPALVTPPPPVVMVSQPVERSVTDNQVFTARTQAVESVDIKARVSGYLTEIKFKDGSLVNEGEVLFKIDDRPYKAASTKPRPMCSTRRRRWSRPRRTTRSASMSANRTRLPSASRN